MLGTLARAGAVLDLFTTEEPEWGVTATAQRLGIGKSLAHDVLASLAGIGLLQRFGHGRYRLGWRTVTLASVLLRTSELKTHARPVVRDLAERQGLTVSLAAWDCGRIIYIDRRSSARHPSGCGPAAGTAAPLDGSAASKVLLAARPRAEVQTLWCDGLVHTGHASADALELDLELVRRHGWAHNRAEETAGSSAVAAPVREADGNVAAAISLDLLDRFSSANVDLHARAVVAAASRITAAIRQHAPAA
ncbi:MAG TPA: IclR family transcriptional regulator [Solirubrobacteraceae bacterium]|jgi:DNA-binding IclR family transcriptional regulator|nr:IclR family transcriptional regulator [Solirubrobacteraceae bacterium]